MIENYPPYPKELILINSEKGFDDLVSKYFKDGFRLIDSYEKTEEIHFKYFGKNRYSCFESYRQCRYRRVLKEK